MNGTGPNWLKIKCTQCYQRCILGCSHFAFCLKQTWSWWKNCTEMFSRLRDYTFNNINMTAVRNNDLSYHIEIKYCHNRNLRVFAIKITLLSSGSGENGLYECLFVFIQRYSHTFLTIIDLIKRRLSFFSFDILIFSLIAGSNHDCSYYRELKLAGIEDTCQQIVNGTGHSWLRMICQSGDSKPHHRCFFWCRDFAFCLNQTSDWRKNCTDMFSQFWSPQLNNITMAAVRNNDASYHFQVKHCQRGSPDAFAIKITLLNSGSTKNGLYECLLVYIQRFSHTFLVIVIEIQSTFISRI